MNEVKVWRVLYTSIARVRADSAAQAVDRAHRVAGAALKRAHEVTPSLAEDVDIENIDMVDVYFCGTEEAPRRYPPAMAGFCWWGPMVGHRFRKAVAESSILFTSSAALEQGGQCTHLLTVGDPTLHRRTVGSTPPACATRS